MLALTAFGILFGIASLWAVLLPTMQRSIDLSLATQSAGANIDPQQLRSAVEGTIYVTVGFGAVIGAVFTVIIVMGTVKLWRWVYWFLAVSYLVAALAIPQDIGYALGLSRLSLPAWWLLVSILLALFEVALGLWMILLYRRYGTWARRRVPA